MTPSQAAVPGIERTARGRPKRWLAAIAFLLLIALVAKPIWDGREQFHWGQGVDDGIYWVTAKALASGQGYRLIHLPEQPFQTKYPPLYPLYLSLAWRIGPRFPGNLKLAWAMQASLIPLYLALLMLVLRQLGLSWRRTVLICGLSIATFQFVLLGNSLFSELLTGCFTLLTIALLESDSASNRRASAAGVFAGLAYLTRSAAIPVFLAVPIFLMARKRARQMPYYFATLAPLALAWHVWVLAHAQRATVGYLAEYVRIIRVTGFGPNLGKQISALSTAAAENILPGITTLLAGIPLHHLVLAAAFAGSIRLAVRRRWPLALIFAAVHFAMIACWWFEGVYRLMSPIWPFLLAGIAEEANHVVNLSRRPKLRWAIIATAILLIARNSANVSSRISQVMSEARAQRIADREAYSWIAAHASPGDVVLAWKDSVSFLYTDIPSSHPLFVAYTPQSPAIKALAESAASLPAKFTDGLLLIVKSDLSESFGGRIDGFRSIAEQIPGAKPEYRTSAALIYRFPLRWRGGAHEKSPPR